MFGQIDASSFSWIGVRFPDLTVMRQLEWPGSMGILLWCSSWSPADSGCKRRLAPVVTGSRLSGSSARQTVKPFGEPPFYDVYIKPLTAAVPHAPQYTTLQANQQ